MQSPIIFSVYAFSWYCVTHFFSVFAHGVHVNDVIFVDHHGIPRCPWKSLMQMRDKLFWFGVEILRGQILQYEYILCFFPISFSNGEI